MDRVRIAQDRGHRLHPVGRHRRHVPFGDRIAHGHDVLAGRLRAPWAAAPEAPTVRHARHEAVAVGELDAEGHVVVDLGRVVALGRRPPFGRHDAPLDAVVDVFADRSHVLPVVAEQPDRAAPSTGPADSEQLGDRRARAEDRCVEEHDRVHQVGGHRLAARAIRQQPVLPVRHPVVPTGEPVPDDRVEVVLGDDLFGGDSVHVTHRPPPPTT